MIKTLFFMLRPANLLLLLLAQCFIRFFIIHPVYDVLKLNSPFDFPLFILTVLATLLLAAAGYIINDFFDQSIDAVNKPFRLKINQYFSKQSIINLHLVLNVIAIILAAFAAWKVNNYKLTFVFIVTSGMLWFYSSSLKKMFFVGNIVVALITALALLIPVLFEIPYLLQPGYSGAYDAARLKAGQIIMITISGYFFFAFLSTWIREIVKDMEDKEADEVEAAQTLPIILGFTKTKIVVIFLWSVLIIALAWIAYLFYLEKQYFRIAYIFLLLILPGIVGIYKIIAAATPHQFHQISFLLKGIIFLGILSIPTFYFLNQL